MAGYTAVLSGAQKRVTGTLLLRIFQKNSHPVLYFYSLMC
ncbi:hypothetical protein CLOSTMETH_03905 [[Clostridium] methylpentosum DSM 5476]|uniref:Uncharacterized protein n=1 Tax=[Clostridium] methylpentosum DSM 5476 TaxID=537013 RepID=C0EJ59_9FIRM|nr:hypothetical protein CLOSTMETH_03905 [[Clostridium] methylpentosum DSM 5476]